MYEFIHMDYEYNLIYLNYSFQGFWWLHLSHFICQVSILPYPVFLYTHIVVSRTSSLIFFRLLFQYYASPEGKEQHYFYICVSFIIIRAINFWCKDKEFSEQEKSLSFNYKGKINHSFWLSSSNFFSLKDAKPRIPWYIYYRHHPFSSYVQCEPVTAARPLSSEWMKWWKGVNKKKKTRQQSRRRNTLRSYVTDSQKLMVLRRASKQCKNINNQRKNKGFKQCRWKRRRKRLSGWSCLV